MKLSAWRDDIDIDDARLLLDQLAGTTTDFPNLPPGTRAVALPDNIMVGGGGQTISLSGSPTKLGLLGSASNGNAVGMLTVT